MIKNVSGELSVTWGEKSFTKPLSSALIQLALIVLFSVLFTAVIGFVFLGLSLTGIITLIVLSTGGIGTTAYLTRDYLLGLVFKEEKPSVDDQKTKIEPDHTNVADQKAEA